MSVVRLDPFRDLDNFLSQVIGRTESVKLQSMPLDAYRINDEFIFQVDLPGVKLEDIDITVENNVLSIKAERNLSPKQAMDLAPESLQYAIAERVQGQFLRQIILGDNLDTSKISALYEDGVLTLTIPVASHAKPRKISVEAKEKPTLVEASVV